MATPSSVLPEKSRGQRSLVGYSPRVAKSQTRLSAHRHTHKSKNSHQLGYGGLPRGAGVGVEITGGEIKPCPA